MCVIPNMAIMICSVKPVTLHLTICVVTWNPDSHVQYATFSGLADITGYTCWVYVFQLLNELMELTLLSSPLNKFFFRLIYYHIYH